MPDTDFPIFSSWGRGSVWGGGSGRIDRVTSGVIVAIG